MKLLIDNYANKVSYISNRLSNFKLTSVKIIHHCWLL